jgi:DNA ligase (NAD+)
MAGLKFEISNENRKLSEVLENKSFVVSGKFTIPRDELKKLISQHGGRNLSAVSGETDFLLAGEKMGPEKLKKAEKLHIKIITEAEFMNLINL